MKLQKSSYREQFSLLRCTLRLISLTHTMNNAQHVLRAQIGGCCLKASSKYHAKKKKGIIIQVKLSRINNEFLVPFSSKILENQKFVHDPQELEPS